MITKSLITVTIDDQIAIELNMSTKDIRLSMISSSITLSKQAAEKLAETIYTLCDTNVIFNEYDLIKMPK